MKVKLLDLSAQWDPIRSEVSAAVQRVLDSQQFILGPEVDAFEREIARYLGCSHAIGVSSGSDALLMALMVLELHPGDEIITSPYTFFATAGAIHRLGLKPVFVDIDPLTYNLNPGKIASALTPRTKAIMPIHLFGQSAAMDPIREVADAHGLTIIEDAAQAIGTEYRGRRCGTMGEMACFSFFPSKNLGAAGDAGLVSTSDDALAEKLRIFRSHGSKPKYFHKYVGGNFRIDALQAAILRVKLKYLDTWTEARRAHAEAYARLFHEAGLLEHVKLPREAPGDRHIFNQYVIRVDARDALKDHLATEGIQTEVYYPKPMHLQECFSKLGHRAGDFPESERASDQSLAIPVYPELKESDLEYVVDAIRRFYKK